MRLAEMPPDARSCLSEVAVVPTAHYRIKATCHCLRRALLSAVVLAAGCNTVAVAQRRGEAPPLVPAATSAVDAAVAEASARFGVPASWVRAVIHVESNGDAKAVSRKGAIGLMQLMPDTWAGLRLRYGLGDDPASPRDNILGGTAYLGELYERFGAAGFLAAYNAGPSRYLSYLTSGRPLAEETRLYLANLESLLPGLPLDSSIVASSDRRDWRLSGLFTAGSATLSPAGPALLDNTSTQGTVETPTAPRSRMSPLSHGLFAPVTVVTAQ
jgi:hypothetical protein